MGVVEGPLASVGFPPELPTNLKSPIFNFQCPPPHPQQHARVHNHAIIWLSSPCTAQSAYGVRAIYRRFGLAQSAGSAHSCTREHASRARAAVFGPSASAVPTLSS